MWSYLDSNVPLSCYYRSNNFSTYISSLWFLKLSPQHNNIWNGCITVENIESLDSSIIYSDKNTETM